ncbi:MAG: 2'-5' RNA ligase family protein [Candidatus Thorarchaeota archaeon]
MEKWDEWQKVYLHGTLVIWPPEEVREIVNHQRKVYDPKSAATCETHITLTQPLLNPLVEKDLDMIRKIVGRFKTFDINYGPLKSFLPYPCIWYEIQPVEKILAIREALHKTKIFNLSLKHTDDFIPHMTITEGLSGPEVNEALLEQLKLESYSGTFKCRDVTLIIPDEKFHFWVKERFLLE